MSKSIQDPNMKFIVGHMKGPEARFYRKNCRANPVYLEIGHDRLINSKQLEVIDKKDMWRDMYTADKAVGRRFITKLPDVNNSENNSLMSMSQSNFKKPYTNTCVWVKGNNPFSTDKNNFQPKFAKTQQIFNFKQQPNFIDQHGNSNVDWGMIAMGKLDPVNGALLCAFCRFTLVTQKDIMPHTYKKPYINQHGDLKFKDTYINDSVCPKASNSLYKDYKNLEDFYGCTGVFTKKMPYMNFDTSSNGGQILCPNCMKHVGQAKLSGIKCGCGFFHVPGYQLWKSRVIVKVR